MVLFFKGSVENLPTRYPVGGDPQLASASICTRKHIRVHPKQALTATFLLGLFKEKYIYQINSI